MYEIFERIINEKGLTANQVAKAIGSSPSSFYDWKSGKSTPKRDKMQKIADFLGVSVEYLINGTETEQKYYLNDETAEIAQELFDRKDIRVLFDAARTLSPEDIKVVQNMVDALMRKN